MLSGQNCKLFKFLWSLNSQQRLEYKENTTKYHEKFVLKASVTYCKLKQK